LSRRAGRGDLFGHPDLSKLKMPRDPKPAQNFRYARGPEAPHRAGMIDQPGERRRGDQDEDREEGDRRDEPDVTGTPATGDLGRADVADPGLVVDREVARLADGEGGVGHGLLLFRVEPGSRSEE
jgi:hypothetical protein